MNPLDWVTGGVSIINKLIEVHKIDQWARLIFGFVFSWFVAFSGATGVALLAGHTFAFSSGSGLVSGAGVLVALFKMSDKTKGIMFAVDKDLPVADSSQFQAEVKGKEG